MAESPPLSDAIAHYRQALRILQRSSDRSSTDKLVLDVLTGRDRVQGQLDETPSVSADHLMELHTLDQSLKGYGATIARTTNLGKWRSLVHPPETHWWWHPEPPSRMPWLEKNFAWLHRFDAVWSFLTLLLLTLSVTLFLNTLSRFAEGGLDRVGTWTIVVQALLTLAGGTAALTKQGRQCLEGWLLRLRIPKSFWQEFSLLVSVVAVFLVFCIYQFGLPRLAQYLHAEGHKSHYQRDHFDSALQYYQKAIALQPNFAEAHYHLGYLFEELQQPTQAVEHYQIVIQSNLNDLDLLTTLRAHNNLGRLYIIDGKLREAWTPLERGVNFATADAQADPAVLLEVYNLRKNLGWLRVEQGHFIEAEEYLREAIALGQTLAAQLEGDADAQEALNLRSEPAAAYCLAGQALEGLGRNEEALEVWGNCLAYGRLSNADEAKWLAVARERLSGFGPGATAE